MGRLLSVVVASIAVFLAGCGSAAVLDLAPLSDFVDLHVKNDTGRAVTIAGLGFRDRLGPESARDEAAWRNSSSGVARIRVLSSGRTLGCLAIRYRKGQQHATALVSAAAPCRS